ncbi:MAG: hypothetical protein M5U28_04820 [Sandaracinaceae bacterium]|nr:hypothetical protein [Sandaracinaceae bacterium]
MQRYTSLWGAGPAEVFGYGRCSECPELRGLAFERLAGGTSTLLDVGGKLDHVDIDGLAADDAVRVGHHAFIEVYDGSAWRRPALDLRQPGARTCPHLYRVLPVDGTYYVFGASELVIRRVERAP